MAMLVMELTERNLTRHDERLAEIREKRMIDPNSEKFYRIWSWIRDVNEQLASNGQLTTPLGSRPSTAQGQNAKFNNRPHHLVGSRRRQLEAKLMSEDGDDDEGVEDLMGSSNSAVPIALLNVTTATVEHQRNDQDVDEDIDEVRKCWFFL